MRLTPLVLYNFVFAGLLVAGGVIGYLQAGSLVSLVAGMIAAGLLEICAVFHMRNYPFGRLGMMLVSILLGGFFAYRMLNGAGWMPGAIVVSLSVINLIWLATARVDSVESVPDELP